MIELIITQHKKSVIKCNNDINRIYIDDVDGHDIHIIKLEIQRSQSMPKDIILGTYTGKNADKVFGVLIEALSERRYIPIYIHMPDDDLDLIEEFIGCSNNKESIILLRDEIDEERKIHEKLRQRNLNPFGYPGIPEEFAIRDNPDVTPVLTEIKDPISPE